MTQTVILRLEPKQFPPKQFAGKICLSPFVSVEVTYTGQVRLCGCAAWMPATVGNLFDNSIGELLSSALAQDIRRSIGDGSYRYCDADTCGIIRSNGLNDIDNIPQSVQWQLEDSQRWVMPHEIFFAGDVTCNLSCPSCRTEVQLTTEDERERQEELGQRLKQNLFSSPTDQTIRLHLSTSGELFASPMLLRFVNGIRSEDFPNLKICIQTNGLLMPHRWHRLGAMTDHVEKITITVDAARGDTYEKLRRGGSWRDMQHTLAWTQAQCAKQGIKLHLRMIAQLDNYKEIVEFYDMAHDFGADCVEYARIHNWGTFSIEQFFALDVFDNLHPQYTEAQEQLNQVRNQPDVLLFGGL